MQSLDFYKTASGNAYAVPDCWLIAGLPVAALFDDNAWHRGIITNFAKDKPNCVNVAFVDYGGTSSVHRDKIRLLRRDFFSEPAFAIRVALFGILPRSHDGNQSSG